MQQIIESIRAALHPHVGVSPAMPFAIPEAPAFPLALQSPPSAPGRFVRKIPKENYEHLGKLIPINWLHKK